MPDRSKPKPKLPPKPKNPKPKKYTWVMGPKGVDCYESDAGGQTVYRLWQATKLSSFHDAELAQATKEINSILERVAKRNRDASRFLSLIEFENRHLLVWARYGVIGPDADRDKVVRALHLRT
jgi:hypothetical protein